MKKLPYILLIISGIIILPDLGMYYETVKFNLTKEDLPQKYKNITTIDSLKDDVYDIIEFTHMDNPIELKDGTCVVSNSPENRKKIFYKIDLSNKMITFTVKNPYCRIIDDFILDIENETYCLWIRNGDTTFHKIIKEEYKLYSLEEMKQSFPKYITINIDTIQYPDINEENGLYKYRVCLYNGENFRMILVKSGKHLYQDSQVGNKYEITYEILPQKPIYTYKKEYLKETFWRLPSFNPTGPHPAICWLSDGYYTLKMPLKELYFKQFFYTYCDGRKQGEDNAVYRPKNKNILFFSNGWGKLGLWYLIIPKSE